MKTQKKHPMLVEHPSQRKSNTHPKTFSPQPIRPRTTKAMMRSMMIPMTSIIYNIGRFLEKTEKGKFTILELFLQF